MWLLLCRLGFYAPDGASVVYSEGGGIPGLIQREVKPKLLRAHCLSHRCALVLKDSVEKGEWALWCDSDEIMHDTIDPFARLLSTAENLRRRKRRRSL